MIATKTISFSNSPFIVFEGVNGGGKTTLMRKVSEFLTKNNLSHRLTREPGGTDVGKELRRIVQESPHLDLSPYTELFLFAADGREHVEKLIRPTRAQGSWVLSDRFYYSTLAFQGYGRGLPLDTISSLMKLAIDGEEPDLVILLDLDVTSGLKRVAHRQELDTFEREDLNFHQRVWDGFLDIAKTSPTPFAIIDASKSPEEVFSDVLAYINQGVFQQ